MKVAQLLVDGRERLGLSQRDLASRAGISNSIVSMIEAGQRKPSVSTARRLARVLGDHWTAFFDDEK